MTHTVTSEYTGKTFRFPSRGAYEAAEQWYDSISVDVAIDYYVRHDEASIGEIWEDENCTKLTNDYDFVIMSMWAYNEG